MTLDEALTYATARHPRLLAAAERLDAANIDAQVPSAAWLPKLGAMAQIVASTANNSTSTVLGQSAVDLPRVGATPVSPTPNFTPWVSTAIAVGVRQQIWDFGRTASEEAAARLLRDIESYRARGAAFDTRYAVAAAYYGVLAAASVQSASEAALERATQHRDYASANVKNGLRPPIELTRAEADVARYEAALTRARGALHVARTWFAATVGVDDAELDAAGLTEAPTVEDPELAVKHAQRAPQVLESQLRVEEQRALTRRLEASTLPNLSATAALSGRAGGAPPSSGSSVPGYGLVPGVPNYDLGVVLTWPLLDVGVLRKAEASRARERALSLEAKLALRTQEAVIRAAWNEATVAQTALEALERSAKAAADNYDQADHRFRVGLGTSTELADAQALRTQAEVELAIGRFQLARTRIAFERSIAEIP